MAALLALLLVVALAVAGGTILIRRLTAAAPDYPGAGHGSVAVQVPKGASASRIGRVFFEKGVVKSARAFREAARSDARAVKIQPGWYDMHLAMKATLALDRLFEADARIRSRFTVPEGATVERALDIIAKSVDDMPLSSLRSAADNPAALGLPSWAGGHLEGLLFPATYDVEPGTSAVEVLTMMVTRFSVAAETADLEGRAAALGITPYELLTVASLVEGEARYDEDRPKVARVAYNRLARAMRLRFDSTVKYAWAQRGVTKTRLFNRDLTIDSPYNTYQRAGLPPGPIDSPGDAALEAAGHPATGSWLYFVVVDKAGHTGFATTEAEFRVLVARYRRDVLGIS